MKLFRKVLVTSVIAAALMGSSTAWGASLSTDSLKTSEGHIMADVVTQAGIGDFEDKNGDALAAAFRSPSSVLALADGSLLVADSRNHQIRKISNGKVTTFAGPELAITKNDQGFPTGSYLDGKASESFFNEPAGLAVDSKGNVYVADATNNSIRKIDASLQVTTLAGSGTLGSTDGKGSAAQFNHPNDVVAAADGSLYVADTLNHLIRKVSADGTVTTLNAASARTIQVRPGQASFAGEYKDGSLKDAKFNEPSGLALDAKGNLYVSDAGNQRIRYIDLTAGTVTTVAGANLASDGKSQYDKDALYTPGDFADGDALKALFDFPKGIAVTSEGGLLIADSLNHSIRYLLNGKVSTITGTLKTGEADGVESAAEFYSPTDVTVLADGSIVVADAFNNKIRKVSPYQLPKELPTNEEVKVVIGNKVISFDAQPEIVNGRTMIPVRAITEALGYEVKYAEQNGTKTVQLIKGDVTIELYIDKTGIKKMQKDQQDIMKTTDVAPYINSDRTYVPVRFFAEEIGLDVQWDQTTRTAILRHQSVVK
jgi:sugar lactone lactonase YvrE